MVRRKVVFTDNCWMSWQRRATVSQFSVAVHLEGSCEGQLFDCRDVSFIVGEAEDKGIPFGVDRAIDKMQKRECCLLYLSSK